MMAATVASPGQFVLKRLPATDDELWWLIAALWGYRIPRQGVCPGHVSPFRALSDAYFARYPSMVWKASRGLGGKSRTLAVLGLTEAVLLGIEVTILGGSFAQSTNVHDATKQAWDWYASPKNLLRKANRFETTLTHGGHLRTLTASQTSVRGPHPPRLRMDEIDEMDQGILDAALGQPMEQVNHLGQVVPTQTVMSSTHQYPDKAMTEMIKRAKKAGHPVYEWCWKETSNQVDGWLTPQAIARARSVVSELMWKTEYDLQEPSFGSRAIDTEAVKACFDEALGTFSGDKMVLTAPVAGRHYITGVDWAQTRDQTIIATFDTTETPWTCVAWHKVNRLPWPMLVKTALAQWKTYGGKFVHDNTGVGRAAHDLIREYTGPALMHQVHGVTMGGGRARDSLYTEYIAAIEHGDIKYPRITYAYDEHRYVTPDDLFGKGHPPDSVVAGALAWAERRKGFVPVAPGGGSRSASPWDV